MARPSTLHSALTRRTSERGAVLVEAALAIPLLIVLIFGAIEAGMAWEARSSSTSGVRTGLLRAASLGDKPETDLRILQSVVGEIGPDRVGDIGWVVIFDATNPDHDTTVANCAAAAAGGGLSTTCNTYTGAQLAQVVAATITIDDFDDGGGGEPATYTCDSSKLDSNWCAGSRLGAAGAVNVGVAVRLNHDWFTGVLPGDGIEFTEFAVSSTLVGDQA